MHTHASTEQQPNTLGLGAMLRHAREAAGLSPADLARQLNLSARIVDAMEQENLQALPAAVYVHGYLRKWADVLQLDEQQLQQAYARLTGELRQNELRHATPIEPMRMKKAESSSLPWLKIMILITIIGIGIYAARFLPESMRMLDSSQESPSNIFSSTPMPMLNAPALPSIPLMPTPAPQPTGIVSTPGIVVGEALPTKEPNTSTDAASNNLDQALPPTQPQGLELSIQNNAQGSWVRVKDADARVLFEGTLAPGSQKKLDGKRPFEITIGRASDLSLSLDGQVIDLKAYARQGGKAFISKLGNAESPSLAP